MAPCSAQRRSNGSTFQQPHHAISPLVRPVATPAVSDAVLVGGCPQTERRPPRPRNGVDRIGRQSAAATRLAASDPTSTTSASPSNKFAYVGASATLLLPWQLSVCCIHRLNPPPRADVHRQIGDDAMVRAGLITKLLSCEQPLLQVLADLATYGWNADAPLAKLNSSHIRNALHRYVHAELSAEQVGEWAEAIECREDIAYDPDSLAGATIFELTNPELTLPLNRVRAEELLQQLSVDS